MNSPFRHIGKPHNRVDGRLKVTGQAKYAAEYDAPDLLHAYIVPATIASGRLLAIREDAARAFPGVVDIFTHESKRDVSWWDKDWRDEVSLPGHPFRPLHSDRVLFDGQPVALVVAESFEAARDAAALVEVLYDIDGHDTDLEANLDRRYEPKKKRTPIPPPPKPRGDARAAFVKAPHSIEQRYGLADEHHNPMELFASTVVFHDEEHLTIYDKTQGPVNSRDFIAKVFELKPDNVTVINRFVGGAFGSALRPHHNIFLAVMAALKLKRSVRLELSRRDMFYMTHRPHTVQTVGIAGNTDGALEAMIHDAVHGTSFYEDYQENVVNWSGLAYKVPNTLLTYELVQLNGATPGDMRAPGAATGVHALETAMDEFSYVVGIDPLELRLRNFNTRDEDQGKEITSKALHACYRQGAESFGWDKRLPEPRSMREGKELVGYGMAGGIWDAMVAPSQARVQLRANGKVDVYVATSDIGTGTYTILSQVAAEQFGLPLEAVTVHLGDSSLPKAYVEGGSVTAASSSMAIKLAADAVKIKLFKQAGDERFKGVDPVEVMFTDGYLALRRTPEDRVAIQTLMERAELDDIDESGSAGPNMLQMLKYISYTHSAVFCEVRVDEELGVVRVKRIVNAIAAGRILNPKTARSQILGGVVMGMGMALFEESLWDHGTGRIMNPNLAEYHVPAHADVEEIEVIFVEENDELVNELGIKGLGEIGIVGVAAAIGNAIFHATGKRVRDLPITIDKILE